MDSVRLITPTPSDVLRPIRNSDRVTFKRCRRKWLFSSGLRMNLVATGTGQVSALWFGTGFHFVMEDFHGYKRFAEPKDALKAYASAFSRSELPEDVDELMPLGYGMIDHYIHEWLPKRRTLKTVWINGVPQVEVLFVIDIPGTPYTYTGTFDRIVEDAYGRYWVLDYKTAKKFDTMSLDLHPQVSSYAWAATELYGYDFEGVIWQQHLKDVADEPRVLNSGELSQDARQNTTYKRYVRALKDRFGGVPSRYITFLNEIAGKETADGDRYVRRDLIRRNDFQRVAEATQLSLEATDMNDPEIALYPNPTRDCSWDCNFRSVCIGMNDGSDWEQMLAYNFTPRQEETGWRSRIQYPQQATVTNLELSPDQWRQLLHEPPLSD